MKRSTGACMLALVLAACGGGEPSNSNAPVAPARQASRAQAQQADPTTGALRVFQAFNGRAPTAAEFTAFSSPDSMVLATGFAANFGAMGDAALSTAILANMRVTSQNVNAASYAILETALAQYFAAYGPSARGVIVNNLVGLLAGLESDATWGAAARTFNQGIDQARAVVGASTSNGGSSTCTPSVVQGFAGDIETAPAGDGGSSGSGGGAAAGGGLGKVLGGTMTVTDLSDGRVVGSGTTDSATGLVTIRTCSLAGPFLLTLEGRAGARYFDEGRNSLVDFQAGTVLHALVDRWDEHVGVSPLTEAAYGYALNNFKANAADIAAGRATLRSDGSLVGLTGDQVRQANALVASAINARLTSNFTLPSAKALPTPVDAGSSSTALPASRYGRSAVVNGGIVRAASHFNPSLDRPALTLSGDLARDLTDGRINGFALDGSQVAAATAVSYESVRLPIAANIGSNAVATQFGQAMLSSQATVDELSFTQVDGGNTQTNDNVDCNGFRDMVALMSDGTVTVRRQFPTRLANSCSYTFSDAENARIATMKRFITDVKFISTGGQVTYAVKNDGTVVGWGENFCGRLSPRLSNGIYGQPVTIPGLRDLTSVQVDWRSTIARDKAGVIYTWGFGNPDRAGGSTLCGTTHLSPEIGVQTNYQDNDYVRINLPNVLHTYTSGDNYFVLTADGVLYGWGSGAVGLLANSDGTLAPGGNLAGNAVATPTVIPGLGRVRKLIFTNNTAFALQVDGTVMAWGTDVNLLIGQGTQRRTTRPTPFPGLGNIGDIAGNCCDGLRAVRFDGALIKVGGRPEQVQAGTASYTPRIVQPTEPVRHFVSRHSGFAVYFTSGRLGYDFDGTYDPTSEFR